MAIGWGNTGFTQLKPFWVLPSAVLSGSGQDWGYCWIIRVLPRVFVMVVSPLNNTNNVCLIKYQAEVRKSRGNLGTKLSENLSLLAL